jgi:hypothetical protein
MSNLENAVHTFARTAIGLTDDDLDRPWAWKSYDSEGIRFAFFRAYEELLALAVKLRKKRAELGLPLSSAQRILGQCHSAYLNLQQLLLEVDTEIAILPPAEGEWPIRRVLAHIIGADIGFSVAIKFPLEGHPAGEKGPSEITDEAWDSLSGLDETAYKAIMESPFHDLQSYHHQLHDRILRDFADIHEGELEIPSKFWEEEAMSIRFRLHRFTSHMRQHSIQIEKTLEVIGPPVTEINRLLKLIYQGLSEADGALIGAWDVGEEIRLETAEILRRHSDEIASSA